MTQMQILDIHREGTGQVFVFKKGGIGPSTTHETASSGQAGGKGET